MSPPATKPCPQCANAVDAAARFCGQCGFRFEAHAPSDARQPTSPSHAVPAPVAPSAVSVMATTMAAPLAQQPSQPSQQAAVPAAGSLGGGAGGRTMMHYTPAPRAGSAPEAAPTAPDPLLMTMPSAAPAHEPAPGAPAPAVSPKRTMMGLTAEELRARGAAQAQAAAPAPAAPPPQSVSAPSPARPMKGTMIGLNAADIFPTPQPAQAPQGPPPSAVTAPVAAPPAARQPGGATMLGVALPGIAPLQPGQAQPPTSSNAPLGAPEPSGSRQQTMLGVAIPGIAPTHGGAAAAGQGSTGQGYGAPAASARRGTQMGVGAAEAAPYVPIVPMPAPLVDDVQMPAPPPRASRRGLPVAIVAGAGAALVLVAGGIAALLSRGGAPLVAQPRLDAQGKEVLHLRCESCPDGTVAQLNGAKTTFQANEADLSLTTALRVGDNPLAIALDRPGMGRDEEVSLTVPLAYRIRTDLSEITAATPVMLVRVEAPPKTEVRIDNKPLTFNAAGSAVYTVDISADTAGPSTEPKIIERALPYAVTAPGGAPERGTVTARVGVVPLQLDAPGSRPVVDTPQVIVAGRTARGAAVLVNGKATAVSAEGAFEQPVDVAAGSATPIEVRSTAASFAPRIVRITVKRVHSLEAEARAFEGTTKLGYDALLRDLTAATGQNVVIEGDVIESRSLGRQTVALVNDRRGCARGPCVTRVVLGRDARLERGETVRAYGRVSRGVPAAGGKTVPEVEADFLLKGRAGRGQ